MNTFASLGTSNSKRLYLHFFFVYSFLALNLCLLSFFLFVGILSLFYNKAGPHVLKKTAGHTV
jgi:hypothetical protein